MAHAVGRASTVKLQQALHGYADGHRQLALSTQLKPRDLKTMLVLSDLSGPSAAIEPAGYLTGYPLGDSKMYAIARTWPAPEMSRPGCVWTHTILINFADIATLNDASTLLPLFRRPTGESMAAYGESVETPLDSSTAALPAEAEPYARALLASLYGKPRKRIVAPAQSALTWMRS
jgi:GTPase-associated protein 1, N-terminal domain type 1